MADKKITDFPEISSIGADDVFLVGGTNATYKAKLAAIKTSLTSVTGVKGNEENSYRTGNVNLTPANIGAMPIDPVRMELYGSSGGAYIDFHYDSSASDYTVRIMESTEGVLGIKTPSENQYYPILTTKNGVAKTGDTMTGPLTIYGDINQQTGIINGDSNSHTDHALQIGHYGLDEMSFYEYGGVFNFYRSYQGNNTLVFQINKDNASSAPLSVNNGGTGATGKSGSVSDLTAGENVNFGNTIVRKWGPAGVLALFFTTTAQLAVYAPILTAASGYIPDGEYNGFVCDSSGKGYPVFFSGDGTLRSRVELPANTDYYGNIAFFTA